MRKINDVKDLVLQRGETVEDLWDWWQMPTTPKLAFQELAKLSTMPHAPADADVDKQLKLATYAEALVADHVPFFALSDASARFLRGHVPGQSQFLPSLAELLVECRNCFTARIRIAPDYSGPNPDGVDEILSPQERFKRLKEDTTKQSMGTHLPEGERYSNGEWFYTTQIRKHLKDKRPIMELLAEARCRFWQRRDKGGELTYPDSLECDLVELCGIDVRHVNMDNFRQRRKHGPLRDQVLGGHVQGTRQAYANLSDQEKTEITYHDFMVKRAKAALKVVQDRNREMFYPGSSASEHEELLRVSREAAAKRKADYEARMVGREDRGIGYDE